MLKIMNKTSDEVKCKKRRAVMIFTEDLKGLNEQELNEEQSKKNEDEWYKILETMRNNHQRYKDARAKDNRKLKDNKYNGK